MNENPSPSAAVNRVLKLKDKAAALRTRFSELKGTCDELHNRLKRDFKVENVAEGRKKLQKIEARVTELTKEINADLDKVNKGLAEIPDA